MWFQFFGGWVQSFALPCKPLELLCRSLPMRARMCTATPCADLRPPPLCLKLPCHGLAGLWCECIWVTFPASEVAGRVPLFPTWCLPCPKLHQQNMDACRRSTAAWWRSWSGRVSRPGERSGHQICHPSACVLPSSASYNTVIITITVGRQRQLDHPHSKLSCLEGTAVQVA